MLTNLASPAVLLDTSRSPSLAGLALSLSAVERSEAVESTASERSRRASRRGQVGLKDVICEKQMKKGLFITFEGGEGTGKTTQIRNLADWLKKKRLPFLVTREPGGTPFADQIRQILLDPKNKGMNRHLELLLYLIARQDHVTRKIRPALEKGTIVLCDRFTDATLAYQGFARGLPVPWLKKLNDVATGGLKPDLTFLFDIPISVGLKRARNHISRCGEDRFEREKESFHQKVRKAYLTLARREKKRFRIIDTQKPKEEVIKKVASYVEKVLP